jgi:putative heme-binding domain-containing protein
LLPLLGNLSSDPNPAVRREVAIALRDVPYIDCRYMLLNLVKGYDGQDRYYLNALGIAADGKQEALFADLRQTLPTDPLEWDQRTANLIWELRPASAVTMLKKRAEAQTLSADARKQAITALGFIKSEPAARAMIDLAKSTDKGVADQAAYWTGFRRGNDWATLLNWEEVMPTKVSADEQKMLAKRQILLDEYKSDSEKRRVALEMARDPEGGKVLVGLAADQKLPEALVKVVGPAILKNPDQTVRTMAKDYFAPKKETPVVEQPAVMASAATEKPPVANTVSNIDPAIAEIAMLTGNEKTGQTIFKTSCATCHRHGQQGNDVGPELTKIHQKFDKNGLLDAIVHPSAGIAFGYEPWLITTKTGQTYYGFLVSDGDQSIVVKGVTGQKHTIPAEKVFSRRQYKTSLMPDPTAMGLKPQQIADITAFLLKQ